MAAGAGVAWGHPRPIAEEVSMSYEVKGEDIECAMRKAGSPASSRAIEMIIEFVHTQIR